MTFSMPCIFALPRFDDTFAPVALVGDMKMWWYT